MWLSDLRDQRCRVDVARSDGDSCRQEQESGATLGDWAPTYSLGSSCSPSNKHDRFWTQYSEFVGSAPIELNVWAVLRHAPPLQFLPVDTHGKEVVVLAVFYADDSVEGERRIQPLRGFGNAVGEHVRTMPYTQWQQAFDPLLTLGARNYWKSHNLTQISDGALDTIIQHASELPSAHCEVFLGLLAEVANDVPSGATAYCACDAKFVVNAHGRWEGAEQDDECIGWSRAFFKAATPYASSGAYVNFSDGRRERARDGGPTA